VSEIMQFKRYNAKEVLNKEFAHKLEHATNPDFTCCKDAIQYLLNKTLLERAVYQHHSLGGVIKYEKPTLRKRIKMKIHDFKECVSDTKAVIGYHFGDGKDFRE
jgi:hypothetical protein